MYAFVNVRDWVRVRIRSLGFRLIVQGQLENRLKNSRDSRV